MGLSTNVHNAARDRVQANNNAKLDRQANAVVAALKDAPPAHDLDELTSLIRDAIARAA